MREYGQKIVLRWTCAEYVSQSKDWSNEERQRLEIQKEQIRADFKDSVIAKTVTRVITTKILTNDTSPCWKDMFSTEETYLDLKTMAQL